MIQLMNNAPLLILAAFSLTASAEPQRPEVGRYVNAYSGEENTAVYVVRLGPPKNAEALVMVRGIDNGLDGVVQKAAIINDGNGGRSYRILNKSGEYEILRLSRESGRLLLSTQPNGLSDYWVSYDKELSLSASAEHLLTLWLEQEPRH